MVRILVTGGAGYIGAHACKALARAGFEPVTYDNLIYGHEDAVKWGPFERGDVLDGARLAQVMERWRPEAVMHFAAFTSVAESVADPGRYYRNNVEGSLSLFGAMVAAGVKRIVFSSTAAVYGPPAVLPVREDAALQPISPYGRTKLMIEQALGDFAQAHGWRAVALRYFNASGADPEGEAGERHEPETHAIPLAIQAALGQGPRFKLFGTDYPTPDGTAVRDYIHVTDLAEAHVKALDFLNRAEAPMTPFNLGIGKGLSVREIITAVETALGVSVPLDVAARRAGDPPVLFADPTKAMRLLNWSPRFADIDVIARTAAAWHRANPR